MTRWLLGLPWWVLVVAAIAFAAVPLGESHLLQKTRMLLSGTLRRPIDWFDLVMHAAPLALLVAKAIVHLRVRR